MTSTETEPWFVAEKRASKAARIASALWAEGVAAEDAVRFTDEQRAMVTANMHEAAASDRTWRIVVNMLAGSLSEPALCPTCGIGDPDGVPGPRKPFQHEGACSK